MLKTVLRHLDKERRTIPYGEWVVERLPELTRTRSIDGSHHMIAYSNLRASNADAVIAAQAGYYRSLGVDAEWKAYAHDGPPDLLERLARNGFEPGTREAVLILDLAAAPAWLADMTCDVERVETPRQVEAFRVAAEAIFEKEHDFTAEELRAGIAAGSLRQLGFLAKDGEKAVSIGRLYTQPGSVFGGLFGGGTLPEYRGRGYYRAVVAARARCARELGARYLIVDARETSRTILERLGFIHLTDTWPCVLKG